MRYWLAYNGKSLLLLYFFTISIDISTKQIPSFLVSSQFFVLFLFSILICLFFLRYKKFPQYFLRCHVQCVRAPLLFPLLELVTSQPHAKKENVGS